MYLYKLWGLEQKNRPKISEKRHLWESRPSEGCHSQHSENHFRLEKIVKCHREHMYFIISIGMPLKKLDICVEKYILN